MTQNICKGSITRKINSVPFVRQKLQILGQHIEFWEKQKSNKVLTRRIPWKNLEICITNPKTFEDSEQTRASGAPLVSYLMKIQVQ